MRAAVYLRQSLDREKDNPELAGAAVSRQRQGCLELCAARGWEPFEYVDNSVSASSRKPRPGYQRMLADIRAGRLDAVVVWDLDRLHRQPRELEDFIDLADAHSLALATVTGDTDLGNDNGRLFARIKGAVARAEVERKVARQKAAHAQRAADGRPWTTRRPFGFEMDGVTHRDAEAKIIRNMYADLLAGVSQSQIARDLNDAGIATTLGNEWAQGTVRILLLNPRNAGLRAHHGQIVGKGTWEPIVDEDTYRAAASVMKRRVRGGGARKFLLAGLAVCDVCEKRVRTGYTNRKVRLYVCPDSHVGRKAESVDELVEGLVLERLGRPDAADLLVDHDHDDTPALRAEADALRQRLDGLATDFADGELTSGEWKVARNRIKDRIADLERRTARKAGADVLATMLAKVDASVAWDESDLARRRAVIGQLMEVRIARTQRGARFHPESVRIEWKGSA